MCENVVIKEEVSAAFKNLNFNKGYYFTSQFLFESSVNLSEDLVSTNTQTFSQGELTSTNSSLTSNAHEFQGHTIIANFLPYHQTGSVLAEIMDNGICRGFEKTIEEREFFVYRHEVRDLTLSHIRAVLLNLGYESEEVNFRAPHYSPENIQNILRTFDTEYDKNFQKLERINLLCQEIGQDLGNKRTEFIKDLMSISLGIRELHNNPDCKYLSDASCTEVYSFIRSLCCDIIYHQYPKEEDSFILECSDIVEKAFPKLTHEKLEDFREYLSKIIKHLKSSSYNNSTSGSINMGTEDVRQICILAATKAKELTIDTPPTYEETSNQTFEVSYYVHESELREYQALPQYIEVEALIKELPPLYTTANLNSNNLNELIS